MCPSNCYMVVLLASHRVFCGMSIRCCVLMSTIRVWLAMMAPCEVVALVGCLVGRSVSWLDSLSIGFLDTQCKWELTAWYAAQGGASDTFYQLCEIWVYLRVQCAYCTHTYTNTMTTTSATTKTKLFHIYIPAHICTKAGYNVRWKVGG